MKTLEELREENALLQMQLDAAKQDASEVTERQRLEKANAELRERIKKLRADVELDAMRGKEPEQ